MRPRLESYVLGSHRIRSGLPHHESQFYEFSVTWVFFYYRVCKVDADWEDVDGTFVAALVAQAQPSKTARSPGFDMFQRSWTQLKMRACENGDSMGVTRCWDSVYILSREKPPNDPSHHIGHSSSMLYFHLLSRLRPCQIPQRAFHSSLIWDPFCRSTGLRESGLQTKCTEDRRWEISHLGAGNLLRF